MTLDSKDSDIEQLRSQLQALHIGLDSSSIGSGPGDTEADIKGAKVQKCNKQ